MTTHFKSYVPGVTNADEISDLVGHALHYQDTFERKPLLPWEMRHGDWRELEIDLGRVDRLYQIESERDVFGGCLYSMLVRMEYEDTRVFVELSASCDYSGFECQGGGEIYLTTNPNQVMNWDPDKKAKLNRCLAEDGYLLPEAIDNCAMYESI